MPIRKELLVTDYYYHLLNRSLYHREIFGKQRDNNIFLELLTFYSQAKPQTKFSYYRKSRSQYQLKLENRLVTIIAYCLMPTHFHLFVRQELDEGIRTFMQRVSNAYAHYFNIKHEQNGPIFEGPFKAIRVVSEPQFLHLSRYIHINPVSASLVENPCDYQFSSCGLFVEGGSSLPFDPTPILASFKSGEDYLDFLLSREDYQKDLESIKHLTLE